MANKALVKTGVLPAQAAFVNSDAPRPAIIGGLGSAKSYGAMLRILKQKYAYPQLNQAWYLPTYDLISLMAMPRIEEELTIIGQPYNVNKKEYRIDLEGRGGIIFRSMTNPERIIAYETADAIVDELDTLKPKDAKRVYQKIVERTRSVKPDGAPNTIGVVTTPDYGTSGFVYELYKECIDMDTVNGLDYQLKNGGRVGDMHLIEANTSDNIYLQPGYLDQIMAGYDPIMAALMTRGKMVSITTNLVYNFYNALEHDTDRIIKDGDTLHIGVDFNIGGCAAVCYVRDGETLYAVDEIVEHDTFGLVAAMQKRYNGFKIRLYPDSSGRAESTNASQSDIDILSTIRTPFAPIIDAPPANGSIRDRVNATNSRLSKNKLFVNRRKCPRFSNSLSSQGWATNGKPEKFDDHRGGAVDDWNDAGTYPVVRMFPVFQRGFSVSHR